MWHTKSSWQERHPWRAQNSAFEGFISMRRKAQHALVCEEGAAILWHASPGTCLVCRSEFSSLRMKSSCALRRVRAIAQAKASDSGISVPDHLMP